MFTIQIAGEDLVFSPVSDPVQESITGETIAKIFGVEKARDFMVFQWLDDGDLWMLRPNEKARFEIDSDMRFIVFRSNATYLVEVDEYRFQWGAPKIRGDVLKKLAGVDPGQYGVWQQSNEGDDKRIRNGEYARLREFGREVFFTARTESIEGLAS